MPYQNTLPFQQLSEITFECSATEIKIKVNQTLLGTLNTTQAASVFITTQNANKAITFKQISNNEYCQGNTNNPNTDTVYCNQNLVKFEIVGCSSSPATFKMIGWDVENTGQICTGNGHTNFFNISQDSMFKAKIETVTVNGAQVLRLVVKYASNIYQAETLATAPCYSGLYCYTCNI